LDSMVSLIPPKHYFSGDNQSEVEWQKRTQKNKKIPKFIQQNGIQDSGKEHDEDNHVNLDKKKIIRRLHQIQTLDPSNIQTVIDIQKAKLEGNHVNHSIDNSESKNHFKMKIENNSKELRTRLRERLELFRKKRKADEQSHKKRKTFKTKKNSK